MISGNSAVLRALAMARQSGRIIGQRAGAAAALPEAIGNRALSTMTIPNQQQSIMINRPSLCGMNNNNNSNSKNSISRYFSSTTEEKKPEEEKAESNTSEEEAAAGDEKSGQGQEAEASATEEKDPIEEKLATLEAEMKTLKDQLLRSLAEQENIRQIAKRDVSAAKNFAIKSFAKSLLEVSDNLHRALDAVPADALETDANLKTLYDGVKMTNDGLTKAFSSHGIQAYCQEPGDVFDPTKHEALMEYPDPSKEPGTVGQVIKVGFTLNDRVLRPAEVGVIKKP